MKTILITGTSSGFGYYTTLYLANKGYKVYATMRNLKKNKFNNPNITVLELDVTNEKTIENAFKNIKKLDVLINNAGFIQAGFFEDITENEIFNQMNTNFFGVVRLTKKALPLLKKNKGTIINISSVSGKYSSPGMGAYSASKFAIEAISESIRFEIPEIKIHLIEPGSYNTQIFKNNLKIPNNQNKKIYSKVMKYTLKNINDDPNDIAKLIYKIIKGTNKFRFTIGAGLYYKARKLLPFRIIEYILKKFFKKLDDN